MSGARPISRRRLTREDGPPAPIAGYEAIRRHWVEGVRTYVAKIHPGDVYVTLHDEAIMTVLGSCIAACVRDRVRGVGGMNHFMLPITDEGLDVRWADSVVNSAMRYGNHAMEYLINEVLKNGGRRNDLEAKLFGGAKVLRDMTSDIGGDNAAFALHYLQVEGIPLASQDVGDALPRKVLFFPSSGRALVKRLTPLHSPVVAHEEGRYLEDLGASGKVAGDLELF